jgi:plasmid stabilization system protein ParE
VHTALRGDTEDRIRRTLSPLERFPRLGPVLDPDEAEVRFLLGPWRWLIIVYAYREHDDLVAILAFEDGRSARSATSRTLGHVTVVTLEASLENLDACLLHFDA